MILRIASLTKAFSPQNTAVHDVDLDVAAVEIICLLGPSGCGKTTLLRLIAGLETPDAGLIHFDGRLLHDVPPHQRDFGMMFQAYALFPHKNVFANVAFGLQMRGLAASHIAARVTEMLALVDLVGFADREIGQLSGGEQQRVALARSLAPDPRLLLLDEPLGALDRALRERLMVDLRQILKRVGVTVVYVTHDQTEAFAIADRIAVMHDGRIEQVDTPQTLYAQPSTPFVARFLGFHNVLPGNMVSANRVETALGVFKVTASPIMNEFVWLLIKPDAASVVPTGAGLTATVTAVSFRGRYYQVWVTIAQQALMFEMPTAVPWIVGDTVQLQLAEQGIHLLQSLPSTG